MSSSRPTDDAPARSVGVMTVDDQALFRAAVRDVISATPPFELVGEATSGTEAIALFGRLRPDLVLMGVRLSEIDGIETTRRLRAGSPEAVVVLISLEDAGDMAAEVQRSGAVAFIRKQDLCPRVLANVWAARDA
jgi:two-component system invasion response regulator UvrY